MHSTALKNFYLRIGFLAVIFSLFLFVGDIFFIWQNHLVKPGIIVIASGHRENHFSLPHVSDVSIIIVKREEHPVIIPRDSIDVRAPESS